MKRNKVGLLITTLAFLAIATGTILFFTSSKQNGKASEDPAYTEFKTKYVSCTGETSDQIVREKWENGGYSNILCN